MTNKHLLYPLIELFYNASKRTGCLVPRRLYLDPGSSSEAVFAEALCGLWQSNIKFRNLYIRSSHI